MSVMEFGQAALVHAAGVLADPSPAPKEINTEGIIENLLRYIAPILLAGLGVVFIGRANKGEVSRVLTSSVIAMIGLVFLAGAVTLALFAKVIAGSIFK